MVSFADVWPPNTQKTPPFSSTASENEPDMSQGASHNLLNTLYVRGGRIFDTLEHQYEPTLSPFE
jgi:hypothetical protein